MSEPLSTELEREMRQRVGLDGDFARVWATLDAARAHIAALREALERAEGLLHNANDALESDGLDERRETFEHIQDYFDPAEMGGCGDVLAATPAASLDALKRAHVESLKGHDDVALVRITRQLVAEMGARTADGSGALSYSLTDREDGTSDLLATRTEDGWLTGVVKKAAESAFNSWGVPYSDRHLENVVTGVLTALLAEARHE